MDIIEKLKDLERESIERGIPILGSVKGKWLLEKVKELNPKKILELGTANGYSGIILSSGGAELTTIEIDRKIAEEAKSNFAKFNVDARIIIGDAVEIIDKLEDKFDLIFIDFEKSKYIKILGSCVKILNNDGCIIADNIFFEGCKDYKKEVLSNKKFKT
ncbi:MAG: class I SAM-dependent methyltransferase, partial [Nanoarchaeota archaeon]